MVMIPERRLPGGAIPADSLHPTRGGPVKPKDARCKAWRFRIFPQDAGALAGALLHQRARTVMTPRDLGRAVPAGPPPPNVATWKTYQGWKAEYWPDVECVKGLVMDEYDDDEVVEVYRPPRAIIWPVISILIVIGGLIWLLVECGTAPSVPASVPVTTVPHDSPPYGKTPVKAVMTLPRIPPNYRSITIPMTPDRADLAAARSTKASYPE